jgi:GTP pyrophosphokinase
MESFLTDPFDLTQDFNKLHKAVWLAERLFKDVKDKSGFPYVGHLYRVAARVAVHGTTMMIAAMLHDAIEDTDLKLADIWADFGSEVALLVFTVSRQPDETYAEFIHRIADTKNVNAIRLKLADLADNTDPARPKIISGDRYTEAISELRNALRGLE